MESPVSKLSHIENEPQDPITLFLELLEAHKLTCSNQQFLTMNIATSDREFGALNRTVVFRGLVDNDITFVTERNSRKYENLMSDSRISVTIFLGLINYNGVEAYWQVRLIGKALEHAANQISEMWKSEAVFAKIRSIISECGKPIDYTQFKETHDNLLRSYEKGENDLPQTKTYTAFKIVPSIWDFYKAEEGSIADRVQYRKVELKDKSWNIIHVAP